MPACFGGKPPTASSSPSKSDAQRTARMRNAPPFANVMASWSESPILMHDSNKSKTIGTIERSSERLQPRFDFGAARFQKRRQRQFFAERLHRLPGGGGGGARGGVVP